MVPCTTSAPRATATSELATAQPASLWAWMPTRQAPPSSATTRSTTSATCMGSAAPLVSHRHDGLGPRLGRRPQAAQRVVGVGGVGVEEVLGVVEDPLALLAQEGHRLGDHAQVLVAVDAQHLLHVQVPGLAHDARRRAPSSRPGRAGCASSSAATPLPRVMPKAAISVPPRCSPLQLAEELLVLGIGPGEAALDDVHAQVGDAHGDAHLLVHRHAQALALHAVAQGGVVEEEGAAPRHHGLRAPAALPVHRRAGVLRVLVEAGDDVLGHRPGHARADGAACRPPPPGPPRRPCR